MRRDDGRGFEKQAGSRVTEKCGRLSCDRRPERRGRRDQLLGRLPEKTGPLTGLLKRELQQWQHLKARPSAGFRTELP
jgi:uncharacterized protein YjbJ (UPF0337 family)